MKRKLIAIVTAIFLITTALMGCSHRENTSAEKDSLVLSVGGGITEGNYDPCKGYGIYGYSLFHTSLLKITTDITTECDLASEYHVSDDGLVYTFTTVSYTHLDVYKRQIQNLVRRIKNWVIDNLFI